MTLQSFFADAVPRRLVLSGLAATLLPVPLTGSAAGSDSRGGTIAWPELRLVTGGRLKPEAWVDMPAIVVFWETWCPFCKRHNGHMEKLHQATRGKKLRILGATTETDEAKVQAYVQSNQLHFPVALVDRDFRSQFTTRRVIPLTCLVSASSQLMQVIPGEMAYDDVLSLGTEVMKRSSEIGNT